MWDFFKSLAFMNLHISSFLCICGVLDINLSFQDEKDVLFLYRDSRNLVIKK